jgi:hypothetical protein
VYNAAPRIRDPRRSDPMEEINPLLQRLSTLEARTDALRGLL